MTDLAIYKPGSARAVRRRVNLLLFGIDSDSKIVSSPAAAESN